MDLVVIKNLTPETNAPHILRNVARWHNARRPRRNAEIAQALFSAAADAERSEEVEAA